MKYWPNRSGRRGVVLILVLWLVIVLGVIGLAYAATVRTQLQVYRAGKGHTAALWAARAGVEKAKASLMELTAGTPINDKDQLFDDEKSFRAQPVGTAFFSLVTPALTTKEEKKPRYGLVDEASRLNINNADENMLLQLPSMTQELAECLIDWRDGDQQPQPLGAEDEYYQSLKNPYLPRNGALTSLRELLMVKGWAAVFERAWPDPYTRFAGPSADTTATDLDPADARALLNSLTAWSVDTGKAPDGQDKLNLGSAQADEIRRRVTSLSEMEAKSIVEFRNKGGNFGSVFDLVNVTEAQNNQDQSNQMGNQGQGRQNQRRRGQGGGSPESQGQPGQQGQQGQTGQQQGQQGQQQGNKLFDMKRLAGFIDYFKAGDNGQEQAQPGLINVNTASRDVLMTLPGMDENLVTALISAREANPIKMPGSILESVNSLSEDTFRQIYAKITTTSNRYHVTSRGYEPDSRASVTVEAVLATESGGVKVIYWREDE